jgi:hypothetical protein
MTKHLIALAAAAFLAGCGGGSDEATTTASTPAAAAAQFRTALAAQGGAKVAAAVSPAQAAEQLLNFAESTFPNFFPGHQATGTYDPFLFRYYPQTGIYVGVVVKAGMGFTLDGVYLLGGPFGNTPFYVGQLGNFITPVDPGTGGNGNVAGPNNGCYDLGLLETTGTRVDLAMQYSGDQTGTVTQVWTVNGPKTFEGQAAVELEIKHTGTLTTAGVAASVDIDAKGYDKRTGDFEVTSYGSESVITASAEGFNIVNTSKTVDTPPSLDRQYGLAVGQSVTQSSTIATTTTTTGIPGLPATPKTTTSTTTETIKIVGREQVTVPAKTYSACKFESTFSTGGVSTVTTTWVIDGKGIPVKIQTTVNGVVNSTQQATSVKLNGQAL